MIFSLLRFPFYKKKGSNDEVKKIAHMSKLWVTYPRFSFYDSV